MQDKAALLARAAQVREMLIEELAHFGSTLVECSNREYVVAHYKILNREMGVLHFGATRDDAEAALCELGWTTLVHRYQGSYRTWYVCPDDGKPLLLNEAMERILLGSIHIDIPV